MSEIKERPILFSAPMVRAILEGRKTVTRRAVKPQPEVRMVDMIGPMLTFKNKRGGHWLYPNAKAQIIADCPYGKPGDRLWVRETFALLGNEDGCCIDWQDNLVKGDERGAARIYRASCPPGDYGLNQIPAKAEWKPDTEAMEYDGAWRPSIHMPRWASRILLEITDVRVERLQDISRADIRAEGLQCPPELASDDVSPNYRDWYPAAWRELWESTGGNWDANPWVWVVEFKRVTP
ncbi:morphogenetic protein [Pseudomonas lactis]|uniref:morphogenetic protein n=1 Tax=Pseudomonas lactis TaxID=1615674 RepID=UPI0009B8766F|nr:morphogenetic protein [Pseudomonas lactis]